MQFLIETYTTLRQHWSIDWTANLASHVASTAIRISSILKSFQKADVPGFVGNTLDLTNSVISLGPPLN